MYNLNLHVHGEHGSTQTEASRTFLLTNPHQLRKSMCVALYSSGKFYCCEKMCRHELLWNWQLRLANRSVFGVAYNEGFTAMEIEAIAPL